MSGFAAIDRKRTMIQCISDPGGGSPALYMYVPVILSFHADIKGIGSEPSIGGGFTPL